MEYNNKYMSATMQYESSDSARQRKQQHNDLRSKKNATLDLDRFLSKKCAPQKASPKFGNKRGQNKPRQATSQCAKVRNNKKGYAQMNSGKH